MWGRNRYAQWALAVLHSNAAHRRAGNSALKLAEYLTRGLTLFHCDTAILIRVGIAKATLRTPLVPASVTGRAGVVWSFNGSSDIGLTLNGAAVAPTALKLGMKCLINGTRTSELAGTITTMACTAA